MISVHKKLMFALTLPYFVLEIPFLWSTILIYGIMCQIFIIY